MNDIDGSESRIEEPSRYPKWLLGCWIIAFCLPIVEKCLSMPDKLGPDGHLMADIKETVLTIGFLGAALLPFASRHERKRKVRDCLLSVVGYFLAILLAAALDLAF